MPSDAISRKREPDASGTILRLRLVDFPDYGPGRVTYGFAWYAQPFEHNPPQDPGALPGLLDKAPDISHLSLDPSPFGRTEVVRWTATLAS